MLRLLLKKIGKLDNRTSSLLDCCCCQFFSPCYVKSRNPASGNIYGLLFSDAAAKGTETLPGRQLATLDAGKLTSKRLRLALLALRWGFLLQHPPLPSKSIQQRVWPWRHRSAVTDVFSYLSADKPASFISCI